MVKPYSRLRCWASGTTQTWAWNLGCRYVRWGPRQLSHAIVSSACVMVQVKQRHARLLQRSLGGTAVRLQLASLRAWQAVAHHRYHQRVALMRLLSKHLLNRKRHAFHRCCVCCCHALSAQGQLMKHMLGCLSLPIITFAFCTCTQRITSQAHYTCK